MHFCDSWVKTINKECGWLYFHLFSIGSISPWTATSPAWPTSAKHCGRWCWVTTAPCSGTRSTTTWPRPVQVMSESICFPKETAFLTFHTDLINIRWAHKTEESRERATNKAFNQKTNSNFHCKKIYINVSLQRLKLSSGTFSRLCSVYSPLGLLNTTSVRTINVWISEKSLVARLLSSQPIHILSSSKRRNYLPGLKSKPFRTWFISHTLGSNAEPPN